MTNFYPIITEEALEIFVSNTPKLLWNSLDPILQALKDYREEWGKDSEEILTLDELDYISEFINGTSGDNCFIPDEFRSIKYPVYDNRSLYPNLERVIEELELNNCSGFKTFISTPTFIFVNKILTRINYDYDLAVYLANYTDSDINYECIIQKNEIENEILDLLEF